MLQQTQVATVIPYFQRFVAEFPTVQTLAAAPEDRVLRLWEGLGYYRRARQLHAAAKVIVEKFGGQFPTSFDDVRSLPGIGRYTAGAILSIAFDSRLPILEANTVRLFSRLTAFRDDPHNNAGQAFLWDVAEQILPTKEVGLFNQALMELGSLLCTPREPQCDACPVKLLCPTRAHGLQNEIPRAKKKTQFEDVTEIAVVVRRGNKVLVRRCAPTERWAGLWDFPRFPLSPGEPGAKEEHSAAEMSRRTTALTNVEIRIAERLTTIKHGVTRFRITLHCYAAEWQRGTISGDDLQWLSPRDLEHLPLSVTGRKIARQLVEVNKRSREGLG